MSLVYPYDIESYIKGKERLVIEIERKALAWYREIGNMPETEHSTYIKVEKEKLYEILSSSEEWNAWFTDDTSLTLNSDGTGDIRLGWSDFGSRKENVEDSGKILKAIPNKSFIFQWSPGESRTTVSIKLGKYKEGTLVSLRETGYSSSEKDLAACLGCAVGWGEALTLLKVYLEYGIVCKQDL
ncbi:SRPBCC domain-containing protein [Heyndrickxia sporothermodurans]|uniref:SRPBCC family protein n=1 Tax=Heyndrickxia sporothermodurans TaxID=46224 RepID=UPI002DBF4FE5|nr:SRPBCC domain-containing protein [Heyndrickxia sporothermodurans]MEB6551327.1 SRPBCC domain-containing protein [Heyndrickxia sporothermodurans]